MSSSSDMETHDINVAPSETRDFVDINLPASPENSVSFRNNHSRRSEVVIVEDCDTSTISYRHNKQWAKFTLSSLLLDASFCNSHFWEKIDAGLQTVKTVAISSGQHGSFSQIIVDQKINHFRPLTSLSIQKRTTAAKPQHQKMYPATTSSTKQSMAQTLTLLYPLLYTDSWLCFYFKAIRGAVWHRELLHVHVSRASTERNDSQTAAVVHGRIQVQVHP